MAGYSEVMTRSTLEGCVDKLVLLDAMASNAALDRGVQEAVLRAVAGAGSGAEQQATAWCAKVESLQYVREPYDIFRAPQETLQVGGDCDDLALLLLAGLRCLSIPALAEGICDEEGWAFHVRVLIGLPPLAPSEWFVADPVVASEPRWAMEGVPPSSLPAGRETILQAQHDGLLTPAQASSWLHKLGWFLGLGLVAAWLYKNWKSR